MNSSAPTQLKPPPATLAYDAAFITLGAAVSICGPALPWLGNTNRQMAALLRVKQKPWLCEPWFVKS
ncbi:MAG: hypothetical protein NTV38_05375 [Chloroflexi bacterium]|nr:hypothetical protein [Chloroflexota bacterium]